MPHLKDHHKTTSPTYSLCTILPTYIGGPSVLPLKDGAKSVSFSQGLVWKTATEGTLPILDFPGWVHVSDVARAHIAALEREVTGRYIVSEGNHSYEKVSLWLIPRNNQSLMLSVGRFRTLFAPTFPS